MTKWAVILSIALTGLVAVSVRSEITGLFHDDGVYAVSGQSLSEGAGYRITSLPTSPAQTKYPGLYPGSLAIAWKLGGAWPGVIDWLKGVNVICFFVALLGAWQLFKRATGRSGLDALAFVLLVGTNVAVVSYVDLTTSETLFLALTVWAVALHLEDPEDKPGNPWWPAVVVGLACQTRQAGLALAVAGVAHAALSRPRRDLLIYVGVITVMAAPWIIWQASVSRSAGGLEAYYTTYETSVIVSAFGDPIRAVQIIGDNAVYFAQSFDLDLSLPLLPAARWLVYPLLFVGLVSAGRRVSVFVAVFVVAYLAAVLGHPFNPHRYVLPLLPMALLALFFGAGEVRRILAHRLAKIASGGSIALVTAAAPITLLAMLNIAWLTWYIGQPADGPVRGFNGQKFSYSWSGFSETFSWIRTHTRPEDILGSAYDPMYFLYTGRRGVRPWLHNPETYFYPRGHAKANLGDPLAVRRELDALGVTYLVVDPLDGYAEAQAAPDHFKSLLAAYPVTPTLMFTSRDGRHQVYALR